MYQAWSSWGGTQATAANSTAVPQQAAQWPAGYNYAAMTPEMQQQWAAAWASQAQYAYGAAMPMGQPPAAAFPAVDSSVAQAAVPEPPKSAAPENLAQLEKEEEEFERQFQDWEKQFEAWKEQNVGHPDKKAFAQYEKQWQEWRSQLTQKREQMQKAKAERAAQAAAAATAAAASIAAATNMEKPAVNLDFDREEREFDQQLRDCEKQFETWKEQNKNHPDKQAMAEYEKQWQEWRSQLLQKKEQAQKSKMAAASGQGMDPSMYYQQPNQYMYMQPYAYPGGIGGAPQPPGPPFPYGGDGYGQQPDGRMQQQQNPNGHNPEVNNYEQNQFGDFPPQNEFQNYDEYGNMYPPDMDQEQFPRDMNFGRGGRDPRGRGARGRGRGRGRGGRWSDSNPDGMPSEMRPGLLDNPGDFPPGIFGGGPEDFPHRDFGRGGPLRDFPDNVGRGGFQDGGRGGPPRDFQDGGRGGPPRDFPDGGRGVPQRDFQGGGPPMDFPDGGPPRDFPNNGRGGPPRDFPDGDFNTGPENQRPPFDFPSGGMDFPPEDGNRKHPNNDRFPFQGGKKPLLARDAPSRLPPRKNEGPPPLPSNRYPPDDFDEDFNGEPPFDEPPFPPHGDFDCGFPDDFGGLPPFPEDFPPFEGRFPGRGGGGGGRGFRGRGRFPPRGDFDRFGGPSDFPPEDRPPFGPPNDRFFPGDGPRGRGPRHFGPGRREFQNDFCRDGPGPMRFDSKDYTHQTADDFDPHYEFEEDYTDDVTQFRAKRPKRNNKRAARGKASPENEKKSSE